ncbi:MAG: hypothetical protein RBU27_02660 [Bacteroidota bacterium]|jgi:hypothetical protein|nr:hypothetical protein [Bacteroidota bacterium]
MKRVPTTLLLVSAVLFLTSCAALQDIQKAMTNLSRCQFKLESVNQFALSGINLSNKSTMSDFSLTDGARLAASFARNEFPASFTLNVAAINPNDGTGGTPQTAATLTSFAWTLILDNTLTINGDIADPITIPGTGQKTIIPLQMNLDLARFFKERGYDAVVNLALALGGANSSPSRITLRATPRIRTSLGDISYPGAIDIIDKEFRAQ